MPPATKSTFAVTDVSGLEACGIVGVSLMNVGRPWTIGQVAELSAFTTTAEDDRMLPPLSLWRSAIAVSKGSQPFPSMESVAGMFDAWLWLDELFTFNAASKDIALHMKEELHRPLWEDEKRQLGWEYFPASCLLGVAGMMAECIGLSRG